MRGGEFGMYKGKHKTAVKSQKVIAEAFFDILKEKSYYDVSIKEICMKAGISRQTFYSLYGTKEDVIRFYLADTFNSWQQNAYTNGVNSLYDLILFFLLGINEDEKLAQLYSSEVLGGILADLLKEHLDKTIMYEQGTISVGDSVANSFIAGGLTMAFKQWHADVDRISIEDVTMFVIKILSGEYFTEIMSYAKQFPSLKEK